MRRQADVADDALLFKRKHIVQNAVFPVSLQVSFLIQTVNKAKIQIIGLKLFHLPGNRTFDFFQVGGPAIFAGNIVGAEVHLQIHLTADVMQRFAIGLKNRGMPGAHIKEVDAMVQRSADGGDDLLLRFGADNGRTHANDADVFPAMGERTVFHFAGSFQGFHLRSITSLTMSTHSVSTSARPLTVLMSLRTNSQGVWLRLQASITRSTSARAGASSSTPRAT